MPKTILIVDDSSNIRQQLRLAIESPNYKIVEGCDGNAGLAQAKNTKVDLVITDVNMPGMTGLEMLGALRKLPGYASTPAFVLTTESNPTLVQQGKAVGATAWIVKPFKPEVLLKGIQKVLGG